MHSGFHSTARKKTHPTLFRKDETDINDGLWWVDFPIQNLQRNPKSSQNTLPRIHGRLVLKQNPSSCNFLNMINLELGTMAILAAQWMLITIPHQPTNHFVEGIESSEGSPKFAETFIGFFGLPRKGEIVFWGGEKLIKTSSSFGTV